VGIIPAYSWLAGLGCDTWLALVWQGFGVGHCVWIADCTVAGACERVALGYIIRSSRDEMTCIAYG
jgi:hypothetical protein